MALATGIAVFTAAMSWRFGARLRAWIETHDHILLAVYLAAVFALGFGAAAVRLLTYGAGGDLAGMANIAWHNAQGHPFETSMGGNVLAHDVSPVLLLTTPFYAMAGPVGLLFIQSLTLAR